MSKRPLLFAFLAGLLAGIVISGSVALALAVRSAVVYTDPKYDLVAVSWGNRTDNRNLWIYQIQVTATNPDKNGQLDVSARVTIGGGIYSHDFGKIGTASDMGDAMRRFGVIEWQPDQVTIGGADGVKATLPRSELQKHR